MEIMSSMTYLEAELAEFVAHGVHGLEAVEMLHLGHQGLFRQVVELAHELLGRDLAALGLGH